MSSSNKGRACSLGTGSRLFLFLIPEWPYLAMLALALFGVACNYNFAISAVDVYWLALTPFIGIVCGDYRLEERRAPLTSDPRLIFDE